MGRLYAGILGSLAMAVVICRSVMNSAGIDGSLLYATLSMIAFAVVGSVLGLIAQFTVDESVRLKIERELAVAASSELNSKGKTKAVSA
jgi:hypothetical protein